MRIRVSLSSCTGEASSCVCQAVDRLSAEIERLDDSAPPFSLIDTLQIHLNIAHPCSSEGGGRGRGSFHAATRTFYAGAALTYEPWISSDWATRLSDLGDGMARAVAAIHKTRITEAERTAAADVIKAAITRVASSPPTELLSLKPIYLVYAGDDTRPTISFGSPSLWTDSSYRIVVVPPPDALKYAYLRDDRKAAQPKMFKLYRRLETGLEYWEAWPADGLVVEHRGICGERGTTRELAAADAKVQAKMLMDLNVEAKNGRLQEDT